MADHTKGWDRAVTTETREGVRVLAFLDCGCAVLGNGGRPWCPSCLDTKHVNDEDNSNICEWTENEDGCWRSACGGGLEVLDGTPSENNMRYCLYCGKSLKEIRYGEN